MNMKCVFKLAATVTAAFLTAAFLHAQETFSPKASQGAETVCGNARFTVLTSRLIRMEWSADGKFEDRATLGIVNRELPVPQYKVRRSGNKIIITTADVTLKYSGQGKFNGDNLSATFKMNGKKVLWHPGMDDSANLQGTTRTLDRFSGEFDFGKWDKGVISRDGWAVLDESVRQLFIPVDSDWKYWVENRTDTDRCDWYLFAYGHDYTAAVSDFVKIGGRIPLPPKYAFGYWWCRYWQYSDFELVDLADHFKNLGIPADVMIIDMDWHETWGLKRNGPKDVAGERLGWTGYSWKEELFPNPAALLEGLHRHGLKTSLNIHPASGIMPYEKPYQNFVKDYLSRTSDYDGPKDYVSADGKPAYVPFRIDQQEWADAYFNSVMHPFEKQGVDFWWLDWQQYPFSRYTNNLSNTFWLNYTFFNDKARQGAVLGKTAERPMIYHRWGGVGSHRYQVGFSGDTYATWKVLSRIPFFTATASNIGYGYWGHDIGGHMQPSGVDFTDPELYTRWLQGGVFTPIFKTHSTKDRTMEKRFWVFPDHFDAMKEAIRLRYDLSPYIYSAARQAYDSGICICRPLYYEWPEDDNAYKFDEEYMFGDDILATVVCAPVDSVTALAPRKMWFPSGDGWWDVSTGRMYRGDTVVTAWYTIGENPYFVRAGSVIPMAGTGIGNLQETSDELRIYVAPGEGDSSAVLYEDDGTTQAYATDYATTSINKSCKDGKITVRLAAREGSYCGMPAERVVRVDFAGAAAPGNVSVDGREVPYHRFAAEECAKTGSPCWTYDGMNLTAVVFLPAMPVDRETVVSVETDRFFTSGEKALLHRMRGITPEVKLQFATHYDSMMMLPDQFLKFAGCASYITENPSGAASFIGALDIKAMEAQLREYPIPDDFIRKVVTQATAL